MPMLNFLSNKRTLVLFFMSWMFTLGSSAQTSSLWLLNQDTTWRDNYLMFSINGSADWGSNVLERGWMNTMVNGGHLSSTRNRSYVDKMEQINRFGANAHASFDVFSFNDSLFGKQNLGLKLGVSSVYSLSTGFDKNLFELTFLGNSQMLGDTVELGPFYGDFQIFQKYGVGVFDKRNLSFVQLSYVSGQEMQQVRIDRARMFTSASGDEIQLDYTGEYYAADTSKSGLGQTKGLGLCIDGDFNLPLENNKGIVSLSVRNLGFIKWSSRTDNYSVDSSFVWNGLNIDDVIGLSENGFEMPSLKDTLGIKGNKEQKVLALPTSFHFRMLRKLNGRKSYEAGLMVMPGRTSLPFIYGGFNHYVAPGLLLTERVTFGGFGNLNMGIEAQWLLNNRLYLRAGSNQLLGFLSPNSRGMNGFFGLSFFVKRSESIIESEK